MLEIRKVLNEEMKDALNLVWRVFLEYEAPDYTDEGIKEFKKSIDDVNWVNAREFYGAFIEEKLVGVIATKDATHIALFFVDGKFQGQGIGLKITSELKKLIEDNVSDGEKMQIELTPTAGNEPFYEKAGFKYKPDKMTGMYLWIKK